MQPNKAGRRAARSGFTLIEILVVVMILAILATVVGVQVIPRLGDARRTAAQTQLATFKTALNLYRMDNGLYPTQRQGLDALCRMPEEEPRPRNYRAEAYLESRQAPLDPWGRPYIYFQPGRDGAPYEIVSYGADGRPGGEGENAEVSSSDI
jgi:general secretion pathway protein G